MLAKALQGAATAAEKIYIESVFSTFLYTGNGSTQTITNGIDLSGKGGLVWIKCRNTSGGHRLFDTVRGANNYIQTNTTGAEAAGVNALNSFSSTGFVLGADDFNLNTNISSNTYASWTFRKAAKFFDVVTFTTAASTPTYSFSHALGSTPGCIIIKDINNVDDWYVWHRSLDPAYNLALNQTAAQANRGATWITTVNSTTVASNVTGGANPLTANRTYVAYLFAHDAGGFGDSGNDSVVKCGSFTQASGGTTVDLGWEPQWVLVKTSSTAGNWFVFDNMRGNTVTLFPNLSNAETDQGADAFKYNANGFTLADFVTGSVGSTIIYIAIRRGPMKTPTDATKVFDAETTAAYPVTWSNGFPLDMMMTAIRGGNIYNHQVYSRLISGNFRLVTSSTAAQEDMGGVVVAFDKQDSVTLTLTSSSLINYSFRRAPGFFDVVGYSGNDVNRTISHNLGVAPELMIVKRRDNAASDWQVYAGAADKYLVLNTTAAYVTANTRWNDTAPTSTVFTVGTSSGVNGSGNNYIAYLFATCPGVSKCFNYTGTGTTLQINCGFTNGARLVLIKRTDSTGDWYIWDSARGIISGNDPYLLLNSTAAEVTNTDYIDPYFAGFEISSTAPAAINANGGSFIFLAIA